MEHDNTKDTISANEKSEAISKNQDVKRLSTSTSENADDFFCPDEGKYGWFSFTPDWLQRFNNPKGFLVAFGLFSITQGMLVNGMINVSITTLERRFQLRSFETGIIGCGYDIAFCLLCVFVTYYGTHRHRPRLNSIGSVILGIGALIFALPHFLSGEYVYETDFSEYCDPSMMPDCDNTDPENLHAYLYVLILGQFLHGVGSTPMYTLGYAFIEDSVSKEQASMYLGLANALSIFGPVLGYIIGGYLLSIYVDFDTVDMNTIEITPDDPRWVGAWWVGMLLAAAMAFVLVTGPMAGFPKQLPGTARNRALRVSEVHANSGAEITEQKGFGKSWKDLPIAFYSMIKNPTFMLTTLGGCSETVVISGFATFLPKFIENEFNQTAGSAALFAGVISVPGGIVGHILAGYLVKRFNMSTTTILKYCVSCCVIVIIMSPILLLHCDNSVVAGVNVAYWNSSDVPDPVNLTSFCNSECACQEEYYMPVCGEDGIGYFSACQAGCTLSNTTVSGEEFFTGCSCVSSGNRTAVTGLCDESCTLIAPFLVVFFVVVMICFMSTAPALVVTFRCVPDSQRSFAIGVQWLFMRALGSIPGPILFGAVIDTTCMLWQQKACDGGRGSCWIYDNDKMGFSMLGIGLVCKAISTIFFGSACYFYKPLKTDKQDNDTFFADGHKTGEKVNKVEFETNKTPYWLSNGVHNEAFESEDNPVTAL